MGSFRGKALATSVPGPSTWTRVVALPEPQSAPQRGSCCPAEGVLQPRRGGPPAGGGGLRSVCAPSPGRVRAERNWNQAAWHSPPAAVLPGALQLPELSFSYQGNERAGRCLSGNLLFPCFQKYLADCMCVSRLALGVLFCSFTRSVVCTVLVSWVRLPVLARARVDGLQHTSPAPSCPCRSSALSRCPWHRRVPFQLQRARLSPCALIPVCCGLVAKTPALGINACFLPRNPSTLTPLGFSSFESGHLGFLSVSSAGRLPGQLPGHLPRCSLEAAELHGARSHPAALPPMVGEGARSHPAALFPL